MSVSVSASEAFRVGHWLMNKLGLRRPPRLLEHSMHVVVTRYREQTPRRKAPSTRYIHRLDTNVDVFDETYYIIHTRYDKPVEKEKLRVRSVGTIDVMPLSPWLSSERFAPTELGEDLVPGLMDRDIGAKQTSHVSVAYAMNGLQGKENRHFFLEVHADAAVTRLVVDFRACRSIQETLGAIPTAELRREGALLSAPNVRVLEDSRMFLVEQNEMQKNDVIYFRF